MGGHPGIDERVDLPWPGPLAAASAQARDAVRVAPGFVQISGYHVAHEALSTPEVFGNDLSRLNPAAASLARGRMTMTDPPDHRRLRQLVGPGFGARRIAALESGIRRRAAVLLASGTPTYDLVATLAAPLPVTVVADLLGIPAELRPELQGWAERLLTVQTDDPGSADAIAALDAELHGMDGPIAALVEQRRQQPAEDLITDLVRSADGDDRLSDAEVVTTAALLVLAGHITSTLLIGSLVWCLDADPDVRERVRRDPSLRAPLVEEVLRLMPPFAQTSRVVLADTELAGRAVSAGSFAAVSLLAANRDTEVFDEPDRLEPGRWLTDRTPQHLSFGHGIHYCLGAALARLEAAVVLDLLLDGDVELHVDRGGVRWYGPGVVGLRELPVREGRR